MVSIQSILYSNLEYQPTSIILYSVKNNIYSQNHKELQNLLKIIRVDKNLNQSELAAQLGHSQSYVSKYEAGELQLDVLELRAICNILGVSLPDFIQRLEERIS